MSKNIAKPGKKRLKDWRLIERKAKLERDLAVIKKRISQLNMPVMLIDSSQKEVLKLKIDHLMHLAQEMTQEILTLEQRMVLS